MIFEKCSKIGLEIEFRLRYSPLKYLNILIKHFVILNIIIIFEKVNMRSWLSG